MVDRHDYALTFRIGPSGQAAQAAYAAHVADMVRQVLLTAPGERIDLPEFGSGLRKLIFAPHDGNLESTTEMVVRASLRRWLAREIDVKAVRVLPPDETPDEGQFVIVIEYVLRETLAMSRTQIRVI